MSKRRHDEHPMERLARRADQTAHALKIAAVAIRAANETLDATDGVVRVVLRAAMEDTLYADAAAERAKPGFQANEDHFRQVAEYRTAIKTACSILFPPDEAED